MQDNELIALIIAVIVANKTAFGIADIQVRQTAQPTIQGAYSAPTALLTIIPGDTPRGWPSRADTWDEDNQVMVHTELQQYESTFQLACMVTQDPANVSQKTAKDYCRLLRAIMQSDAGREQFRLAGAGIYQPSEIRQMPWRNDQDEFQYEPSFDFTLTHKQVIVSETPVVETAELQILTV